MLHAPIKSCDTYWLGSFRCRPHEPPFYHARTPNCGGFWRQCLKCRFAAQVSWSSAQLSGISESCCSHGKIDRFAIGLLRCLKFFAQGNAYVDVAPRVGCWPSFVGDAEHYNAFVPPASFKAFFRLLFWGHTWQVQSIRILGWRAASCLWNGDCWQLVAKWWFLASRLFVKNGCWFVVNTCDFRNGIRVTVRCPSLTDPDDVECLQLLGVYGFFFWWTD